MRGFADYNPIVLMLYFLLTAGITMFIMHPVLLVLSLTGSIFAVLSFNNRKSRAFAGLILLAAVLALINPVFNHNGVTVLFILNDNPVTLEACIYGIAASMMIISVLLWCRVFSAVMTEEKILYVFGKLSPKLSMLISMTLRFIPLFARQADKVKQSQKAMGLYKEDNAIDNIRAGSRVFSIVTTWGLENGIITADSMTARGYGSGRRSFYSVFRFKKRDAVLLLTEIILAACVITAFVLRKTGFEYYPELSTVQTDVFSVMVYIAYGILAFIPTITEVGRSIKWKYLLSKI